MGPMYCGPIDFILNLQTKHLGLAHLRDAQSSLALPIFMWFVKSHADMETNKQTNSPCLLSRKVVASDTQQNVVRGERMVFCLLPTLPLRLGLRSRLGETNKGGAVECQGVGMPGWTVLGLLRFFFKPYTTSNKT